MFSVFGASGFLGFAEFRAVAVLLGRMTVIRSPLHFVDSRIRRRSPPAGPQGLQYPFIKEYTLNYKRNP